MAGIYIPGMEMPQGENALLIGILSSGEVYSVFQDNETGELGLCKPKAEPVTAIPVPPHGDLIDRNETAKTLGHDYAYAAADMVRDEMPTIIPADKEADHGKKV